jgi:hypothetical protein
MFLEVPSNASFLVLFPLDVDQHKFIIAGYAFRWKEFCTDTSLEKASLYLQAEEVDCKTDADGLTCLADSLPDWHEFSVGRQHGSGSNIWCEQIPLFPYFSVFLAALILLTLIFNCSLC